MVHSTETKQAFISMMLQGFTINQAKESLGVPVDLATLYRWKKLSLTQGHLTPKKASGRPEKATPRGKRAVINTAKSNPSFSFARVANESNAGVGRDTVRKILKSVDISSFIALKKPKLTAEHARNRLDFAQRHANLTLNDWTNWAFSDESMIELDCAEGTKRFLITPSQRLEPQFVHGKKQQGGGKLMIWSYIDYDGVGQLLFIEGGLDAQLYIEILKKTVYPYLIERLDQNGLPTTWMDDGATCHDADVVIQFCAEKGIQRPKWPSCSPDLNPIEWVWGWIKHKLSQLKQYPRNIAQLKLEITKIWNEIDPESIKKLYKGMNKRIQAVIAANGWNTIY